MSDTPSDIVLGHVAMSLETYERMTPEHRNHAWGKLIEKLDLGDQPYVPILFRDPSRNIVGLNLMGFQHAHKELPQRE